MAIYPKSNGGKVTFGEYNCVKCITSNSQQVLETELENSINLNKLLYCKSLVDIPHDYVVIDSFTDSTGWNNTICTTCTTSSYYSSALTGNYENKFTITVCPTCLSTTNCGTFGNYYACSCYISGSSNYTNEARVCVASYSPTIYSEFGFCVTYIVNHEIQSSYSSILCLYAETSNWQDNYTLNCNINSNAPACCISCTFCYKYICRCANCWDFYKNGSCVCQITLNTFPNVVLCACHVRDNCCACRANTKVSIDSVYTICCTKITTNNVIWANPVKMVYYTDEIDGTGSRTYNVIDATTGCCIACNVPTKCLYLLSCCVCCHIYEIVQCADAVSCIKSYAIATGV